MQCFGEEKNAGFPLPTSLSKHLVCVTSDTHGLTGYLTQRIRGLKRHLETLRFLPTAYCFIHKQKATVQLFLSLL